MKKFCRFTSVLLMLISLFWPVFARADPPTHTRLKLQILPIDCIFEIIDDGYNTIHYLTPEECGVFIPTPTPTPAQQGQPEQTSWQNQWQNNDATLLGPSSLDERLLYHAVQKLSEQLKNIENMNNGTNLVLNNFNDYETDDGKLLVLRVEQMVFFYLGKEDTSVEWHGTIVANIGEDYVVLVIASSPIYAVLHAGDKNQYDVNGDGINDIEIKLLDVFDGTVYLSLKQLAQNTSSGIPLLDKSSSSPAIWHSALLVIILIIGGCFYYNKHKKSGKTK